MPKLQKRSSHYEVHDLQRCALFQRCCWQVGEPSDILEQVELPLRGAGDHRMDIEAWLQGLGLERYAPAFRENEILAGAAKAHHGGSQGSWRGAGWPPPATARRDRRSRRSHSAIVGRSGFRGCSRGRAAPANRDVLRSGRLDAAVDAL